VTSVLRSSAASSGLALLVALAIGCGSEPPSMICDVTPASGDPTVEATISSPDGTTWTDGGDVLLELGGQGGYMVQPVLELPPEVVPASVDRICARVELDNIDPSGGERFVGFETLTLDLSFRRNEITGRYESAPILNQLRWSPLPPATAFRLVAVIRAESFVAAVTRDVLLQPGS
jgi:hypothetical protein